LVNRNSLKAGVACVTCPEHATCSTLIM